jgi:hypothetical protein
VVGQIIFFAEILGVGPGAAVLAPMTLTRNAHASTQQQDNAPRLLYDRKTAAFKLSISVRALDYLIADGFITVQRSGKRVLIPHAELVRFATPTEPSTTPITDLEIERWIASIQASYTAGTLPKWQRRLVDGMANWKWDASTAPSSEGM